MIGRLRGILLEKQPPSLLVEVQGVGYEVEAPMSTFYRLPEVGSEVVLHTHFVVREDAQLLYGFGHVDERALFRMLIKVNGVGPKLALAILSGMEADAFVSYVHEGDSSALVRLPGVGKKTAERLIVEMRDRLKDWQGDAGMPLFAPQPSAPPVNDPGQEAEAALVALGYKPQEASRAISRVAEQASSSEDMIRLALKNMMKV